ncbi:MAG: rod-binding protein [Brevundimonas sp.]|uniref:rod-binding protein n=1 Tax=Brevundimonas sp. TaxID=1871086 RepID=UPI001A1F41B6|nr:rod-binding protein [Brevundimonas sp.]MBJ7447877.1 rod-binding protein [Brevundimonas sp.]
MTDLTVSPALLNASAPRVVPERMRQTAEDFEASFLTQMLKPMFDSLSTEAPFGGGEAEGTWRGFLVEAMAKQTVKAGGIGLTDTIVSEMIKMQEQAQ